MVEIVSLQGFEILDSRGNPTVTVRANLDNGVSAFAAVPSGASTGEHEAIEKRDGDKARYGGKGVLDVISSINGEISKVVHGMNPFDQVALDKRLIELDGTENKSRLGANAILGVSLAVARASAASLGLELYRYLGGVGPVIMPCPMFNVLNGGAHADNSLDFQEFMIRPHAASSFSEALRWGAEVYHVLKNILKRKGLVTAVGDEGGFAPNLGSDEEALDLLVEAITHAGYRPGAEISIAIDCAASELYDSKEKRYIEKKRKERKEHFKVRSSDEQIAYLQYLVDKYPIDSIEDGLSENDWHSWQRLEKTLGKSIQIVGDDIFVTNPKFLERGINEKTANAILIKLNQIGTLTETIEAVEKARRAGWRTVISHRSAETEDSFIADLSVALGCGQIKTGAPCRGERTAKYNRLLLIEQFEGGRSQYLDTNTESIQEKIKE
jgi:enolase